MATPPTFVAEYETAYNTGTTPKTSTPTVALGDILVTCMGCESDITFTAPTATGITFTQRQLNSAASNAECGVWTGAVGTAGSPTLSAGTDSGTSWWGHNTIRFSGTTGVGASNKAQSTGAPTVSLTTTGANSAVVVLVTDWNAVNGSSRTWRTVNGITPSVGNGLEKTYFFDGSHFTIYVAYYSDSGAAGANNYGLSAPTGQKYSIIAIEILGTTGGGSPQTVAAQLLSVSSTIFNPTISVGNVNIGCQLLSVPSTIFNPSVGQNLQTSLLTISSIIFNPNTLTGNVNISCLLLTVPSTIFEASLSSGAVVGSLLVSVPSQIFSPDVLNPLQIIIALLLTTQSTMFNPTVIRNGTGGGEASGMTVADRARVNMLINRVLTEPRRETNTDLMKLVLDDGAQVLVPETDASVGTHLLRYMMFLRNN